MPDIDPIPLDDELSIRPLIAEDKRLLKEAFERLSDRSRQQRFLTSTSHLTRAQLAYLTEIDHVDHVAFGIIDGETPAAVGRWIRFADDPYAADVAITVVDDHQGQGIGSTLVTVLALVARHRRVRWLHFDVLASNAAMLRLLDRFGAIRTESGPVVHAVLDADEIGLPEGLGEAILKRLDEAAQVAR